MTTTSQTPSESYALAPESSSLPRPSVRAIGTSRDACVEICSTCDIVLARQRGRALALQIGFPGQEISVIAAAVSEVARNIVDHAEAGEIIFRRVQDGVRRGLEIVAHDEGPGIFDASRVADYGYGAAVEPGVGLPGVRLLMDEFEIESAPGRGTTIKMKKWLR